MDDVPPLKLDRSPKPPASVDLGVIGRRTVDFVTMTHKMQQVVILKSSFPSWDY
jgi:hypothetical protein